MGIFQTRHLTLCTSSRARWQVNPNGLARRAGIHSSESRAPNGASSRKLLRVLRFLLPALFARCPWPSWRILSTAASGTMLTESRRPTGPVHPRGAVALASGAELAELYFVPDVLRVVVAGVLLAFAIILGVFPNLVFQYMIPSIEKLANGMVGRIAGL